MGKYTIYIYTWILWDLQRCFWTPKKIMCPKNPRLDPSMEGVNEPVFCRGALVLEIGTTLRGQDS